MAKSFEIRFSAQGWVKQFVLVQPEFKSLTAEELQSMLNKGEAMTTVQEGGLVEIVKDGKIIAAVDNVENEMEYTDFEVEVDDAE